MSELIQEEIDCGEFAIFLEFTSDKNLAVPFCVVSMSILSPNTIDHIHTYGRAIEVNEINSQMIFGIL